MSDQQKMIHKYGDHYSWEKTARSVIFRFALLFLLLLFSFYIVFYSPVYRAHQNKVIDEESYQNIIRANNYQTDSIGKQLFDF